MDHNYNRRNRRKYSLKAHIVIVTKYHKKLLTGGVARWRETKSLRYRKRERIQNHRNGSR